MQFKYMNLESIFIAIKKLEGFAGNLFHASTVAHHVLGSVM